MHLVKVIFAVTIVAGILFGGCQVIDEPISLDNLPTAKVNMINQPILVADQTDEAIGKRFADPETGSTTAVQSAVAWSQRYDDLTKKNEATMAKNNEMFLENNDLKQQIAKLKADLDTANTELAEANDFMQDMHGELTKWKSDVLGFRNEMRNARTSELEALAKILSILGAEPIAPADEKNIVSQNN